LSKNFSPEIDAAVITALVTIPLGLATLLGTVWISTVTNRKTVETAIMQQRTGLRDEVFSKKMEVYKIIFDKTLALHGKKIDEYDEYTNWLEVVYKENIFYMSERIRLLVGSFLSLNNKSPLIRDEQVIINSIEIMKRINERVLPYFEINIIDKTITINPVPRKEKDSKLAYQKELVIFSTNIFFDNAVIDAYPKIVARSFLKKITKSFQPSYLSSFLSIFIRLFSGFRNKKQLHFNWYIGFINEYKDALYRTKTESSDIYKWIVWGFFDHLMTVIINELDLTAVEHDFKSLLADRSNHEFKL
jgi:hypothetical protein